MMEKKSAHSFETAMSLVFANSVVARTVIVDQGAELAAVLVGSSCETEDLLQHSRYDPSLCIQYPLCANSVLDYCFGLGLQRMIVFQD